MIGATLENVAIVEDRHGNAAENAALIVRAVNSHDALVAVAQTLLCLETSPRFQGMTVAEALRELDANGAWSNPEYALKLAKGGAS